MQTERVTFLTSRDHKAALDAFAKESGMSVGHVVREATSSFMAQSTSKSEDDQVVEAILPVLEEALPRMQADLDAMRLSIADANAAVEAALARVAELDAHRPVHDWKTAA